MDAHNYPLNDIFQVCQRLNGPLPVYHPQFLEQAILAGSPLSLKTKRQLGKLGLVKSLLSKLEIVLIDQSQSTNETAINTFLDTPLSEFLISTEVLGSDWALTLSYSG